MVDHIKTLLLNRDGVAGYRKVNDAPSDAVMSLFGVTGSPDDTIVAVERLLPFALAPDLDRFRRFFDGRVTPQDHLSPYRQTADTLSVPGLYEKVLEGAGRWAVLGLFRSEDPLVQSVLDEMYDAALCRDAPYAIGAVLIACAYRRLVLQGGGV